ncbi:MAG: hypothetical protein COV10_01655, partial [Candidatus Vogelbacteria bacterium CG10_big_fil_rev_8_21_14_0_10_51_16]
HAVALLVGQLDAIEEKIVETATRGNIRGAIDEGLVRELVGVFTEGTATAFDAARFLENSEIVADIQLGIDNLDGPIAIPGEPVKGKTNAPTPPQPSPGQERGNHAVSEKMLTLGLAKAGVEDTAKLTSGEVKLTAIKGLIAAGYAYREGILQSLWWGSPTQSDIASGERELLEAEEAIVALSRDGEVVPLLTEEYRSSIRDFRFRVHDTREALADWRLERLKERQSRMRRVVNDLRGSYLPEWRGLSQKG